jgi:hypothetical protein
MILVCVIICRRDLSPQRWRGFGRLCAGAADAASAAEGGVAAGIPAELTKGSGRPGLLLVMAALAAGDHQSADLCLLGH